MRCTAIGRTVSFRVFSLLFLLVLASGPARADEWTEFRTAICDGENGYAEFRSSGSFDLEDAERANVVHEYPCPGRAARGFENSWRCDLSEESTITIRYKMSRDGWMVMTIWVDKALVTSRKVRLSGHGYGGEILFSHVSLDKEGLKICTYEKGCDVFPTKELPHEIDPEYRPGWVLGDPLPELRMVAPKLIEGQDVRLCRHLLNEFQTNPYTTLEGIHPRNRRKGSSEDRMNVSEYGLDKDTGAVHTRIDIDNDGKRELVIKDIISESRDWGSRLIIFDSEEELDRASIDKILGIRFSGEYDELDGKDGKLFVVNRIPDFDTRFDSYLLDYGRRYVLLRSVPYVDDPDEIDKMTSALIYEQLPTGDIDILCRFSPPYFYYVNVLPDDVHGTPIQ